MGDGDDSDVGVTTEVAAGDAGEAVMRASSLSSPSGVRELLSATTTTLVEATGATTSTTAAGTEVETAERGTDTPEPTTTVATQDEPAETTTTTQGSTARTRTVAEPSEPAPTTTAAPERRAPSTTTTTAPPTTTTTAPADSASDDGGYAYDDPRSTQVWYDLAQCESGGNWSINTGNGYYGGLQFSLPTWESVGGSGHPHEHPAGTQIELGRRLQARQGWGAWPHCSEKLGLR